MVAAERAGGGGRTRVKSREEDRSNGRVHGMLGGGRGEVIVRRGDEVIGMD